MKIKEKTLKRFGRELPDTAIAKKIKALYLRGKNTAKAKNQEP